MVLQLKPNFDTSGSHPVGQVSGTPAWYSENLGEVLGNANITEPIDNIKAKIREYINGIIQEFNNIQTPIKDVLSNISSANVNAENELKLLQEKKKILSSLQKEYDEEEISEMTQIKSYQEILELVTKIRDLRSDMTVTKGKMSGARQINDSNLAKQY